MSTPQPSQDPASVNALAALRLVGLLGVAIVTPILLGVALGVYIDKAANGHGLLLLGCIVAGIATGLGVAYHLISRELPWKR